MLAGLALLTAIGYLLVSATGRSWFEHDVQMRAELAIRGAQRGLVSRWRRGDHKAVEQLLEDITRDERILGAAACSLAGATFPHTAEFPRDVSCARFTEPALSVGEPRQWNQVARIGNTRAYLSAFPLYTEEGPIGVIGLIHDMSYIEHRDAVTRRAALSLFLLLGVAAVLGSTATARASLRRLRDELHGLLAGSRQRPEFHPLLQETFYRGGLTLPSNTGAQSREATTTASATHTSGSGDPDRCARAASKLTVHPTPTNALPDCWITPSTRACD